MATTFQNLCRHLIGSALSIKGRLIIDSKINITTPGNVKALNIIGTYNGNLTTSMISPLESGQPINSGNLFSENLIQFDNVCINDSLLGNFCFGNLQNPLLIAGNIIPQSEILTLGNTDNCWNEIFVNNVTCDLIQSKFTGFIGVDSSLIPFESNIFNLGTQNSKYDKIFVSNVKTDCIQNDNNILIGSDLIPRVTEKIIKQEIITIIPADPGSNDPCDPREPTRERQIISNVCIENKCSENDLGNILNRFSNIFACNIRAECITGEKTEAELVRSNNFCIQTGNVDNDIFVGGNLCVDGIVQVDNIISDDEVGNTIPTPNANFNMITANTLIVGNSIINHGPQGFDICGVDTLKANIISANKDDLVINSNTVTFDGNVFIFGNLDLDCNDLLNIANLSVDKISHKDPGQTIIVGANIDINRNNICNIRNSDLEGSLKISGNSNILCDVDIPGQTNVSCNTVVTGDLDLGEDFIVKGNLEYYGNLFNINSIKGDIFVYDGEKFVLLSASTEEDGNVLTINDNADNGLCLEFRKGITVDDFQLCFINFSDEDSALISLDLGSLPFPPSKVLATLVGGGGGGGGAGGGGGGGGNGASQNFPPLGGAGGNGGSGGGGSSGFRINDTPLNLTGITILRMILGKRGLGGTGGLGGLGGNAGVITANISVPGSMGANGTVGVCTSGNIVGGVGGKGGINGVPAGGPGVAPSGNGGDGGGGGGTGDCGGDGGATTIRDQTILNVLMSVNGGIGGCGGEGGNGGGGGGGDGSINQAAGTGGFGGDSEFNLGGSSGVGGNGGGGGGAGGDGGFGGDGKDGSCAGGGGSSGRPGLGGLSGRTDGGTQPTDGGNGITGNVGLGGNTIQYYWAFPDATDGNIDSGPGGNSCMIRFGGGGGGSIGGFGSGKGGSGVGGNGQDAIVFGGGAGGGSGGNGGRGGLRFQGPANENGVAGTNGGDGGDGGPSMILLKFII